jgi:hypothetical protein
MKTIDQASKEAFEKEVEFSFQRGNTIGSGERMFKAGAEFAQRWIPVEEELPAETGWEKAPYIARTKKEDHIVGYTAGRFHHKGGLCLKSGCVTSWRPIERK